MQISAEVRLFWKIKPDAFASSFQSDSIHGHRVGGGVKPRTDIYLLDPRQRELSIKLRGGSDSSDRKIEVKGLVRRCDQATSNTLGLTPEIWTKWQSSAIAIGAQQQFVTHKLRWLRQFSVQNGNVLEVSLDEEEKPILGLLPDEGCNIELTRVVDTFEKVWWTLGFESFGSLESVLTHLKATIDSFLHRRDSPPLPNGEALSYPEWIAQVVASNKEI
jgi:hypothetical protein